MVESEGAEPFLPEYEDGARYVIVLEPTTDIAAVYNSFLAFEIDHSEDNLADWAQFWDFIENLQKILLTYSPAVLAGNIRILLSTAGMIYPSYVIMSPPMGSIIMLWERLVSQLQLFPGNRPALCQSNATWWS